MTAGTTCGAGSATADTEGWAFMTGFGCDGAAWAMLEYLEVVGNRGGEDCGGIAGCETGEFIKSTTSGVGAIVRGTVACELSYRFLDTGVGVGGGPKSTPAFLLASASAAAWRSSGAFPFSIKR